MSKIEQLIKDRRDEATEKNISHKLRTIVKFMGKKIIDQGYVSYDEWEFLQEDLFEASESSRQIGWLFQGYVWSRDCEIQYLMDTEELTFTWYGNIVYKEADGVAVAFVPDDDWLFFVEKMAEMAFTKEEKYNILKTGEKKVLQENLFQQTANWLQKTWGIKF